MPFFGLATASDLQKIEKKINENAKVNFEIAETDRFDTRVIIDEVNNKIPDCTMLINGVHLCSKNIFPWQHDN